MAALDERVATWTAELATLVVAQAAAKTVEEAAAAAPRGGVTELDGDGDAAGDGTDGVAAAPPLDTA